MSSTLQVSLILGVLLPPLIAVLQRPTFPRHVRSLIMVVVCIAAAVIQMAIQGKFGESAKAMIVQVIVIIGAAVTFYQHVWSPLNITPRIEGATSPKKK